MDAASWNFKGCSVREGETVSVCSARSNRRTTDEPPPTSANSTRYPKRSWSSFMSWPLVTCRSNPKSRRNASACSSSSGNQLRCISRKSVTSSKGE